MQAKKGNFFNLCNISFFCEKRLQQTQLKLTFAFNLNVLELDAHKMPLSGSVFIFHELAVFELHKSPFPTLRMSTWQ